MSLRDELIPVIDDIRREVVDEAAGLRIDTVSTRLRVWDGGQPGLGTPEDFVTVLDPVPKVLDAAPAKGNQHNTLSQQFRSGPAGKAEEADRVVTKISLTYTRDDLTGGVLSDDEEFCWLIDDEPYEVVGIDEAYLGWSVMLTRKRPR